MFTGLYRGDVSNNSNTLNTLITQLILRFGTQFKCYNIVIFIILILSVRVLIYLSPENVVCLLHLLNILKCALDYFIVEVNMNPD